MSTHKRHSRIHDQKAGKKLVWIMIAIAFGLMALMYLMFRATT